MFKQETASYMRISDWSSDVCSSDLDSGQQGLQIEVSLRTDEAFQLLARRPIDTAVAASQENMLEHGLDRLAARTKIVGNPPRQRPADRKSVVEGKSVSVRVNHGSPGLIKKKN